MRRISGRPSPAMAVAFIALLAALSGTAVALPGKNTVDSGDLKKNAVKAADIARNAVTGPKIRNSAVNGQKVRNDSLTGTDINESTLGQVPSANTANTANTANSANSAGTANSANTAGNADTLDGKDSSDFGPIAFARVNGATATVEAGSQKNMENANVVRGAGFAAGVYCFGGLNPAPRNVMAVRNNDSFDGNLSAEVGGDTVGLCPTGHEQANVIAFDNAAGLENADFHVLFN